MRAKTASGSIYNIGTENKKIRRESGDRAYNNHVSLDGEWRPYLDMGDVIIGQPIFVLWDVENFSIPDPNLAAMEHPGMITSNVVEILEELN